MQKLAALPRIIAVKDATGDVARAARTRLECGADFLQFSGDDALALPYLSHGAVGCISVTGNVAPRLCAELQNAWAKGDFATCAKLRDALTPLNQALFVETNPQPVKYGLSLLGFGSDEMRLPMIPASESTRKIVQAAMENLGLLQAKAA
jgi:4-hydroxy-tetrahydrodipicolinate synthase